MKTFEKLLQEYENALDFYQVKQLRYNLDEIEAEELMEVAERVFAARDRFKLQVKNLVQTVLEADIPNAELNRGF